MRLIGHCAACSVDCIHDIECTGNSLCMLGACIAKLDNSAPCGDVRHHLPNLPTLTDHEMHRLCKPYALLHQLMTGCNRV